MNLAFDPAIPFMQIYSTEMKLFPTIEVFTISVYGYECFSHHMCC